MRGEGRVTVNRPRLIVPTNLERKMVERSILLALVFRGCLLALYG